jgi:hypothetical protein
MVWIAGIYPGLSILLVFAIEHFSGLFTATQIGFILFLLSPLAIGGVLGMLRYDDYSPILFLMQAKKHYFGIVIPAAISALVIVITIILLIAPLSFIMGGTDPVMLSGLCIGVSISVLLTILFYAPIVVSENAMVTHSLLRSIALVSHDMFSALKFWIVATILNFMVFFGTSMAFAMLTFEHLQEYADLSIADQQVIYAAFTPDEWMAMLGDNAFFLVLFLSVCVTLVCTFLLCYLFVCYTDAKEAASSASAMQSND